MSWKRSEYTLDVAEQTIVDHIRRWPSLYHCRLDVFHNAIVGSCGDFQWENGLLVCNEQEYLGRCGAGEPQYRDYPFEIEEETAYSFFLSDSMASYYLSISSPGPISRIPDDAHEDWLDFIWHCLKQDEKITMEFFEVLMDARGIKNYGMKDNPRDGSRDSYTREWKKYLKRIPSYLARIEVIRETRRLGAIPPETYMGMHI